MTEPERTPFLLLIILWCAGLLAGAQFAKISVLFPEMRALYPFAGSGIGFLVSVLSLFGIGFGIVAGLFVSRIGYRRSLLAALYFGAAMSAYQATIPNFSMMMASRIAEGLSHLVIVVAAPTLIAQLSRDEHRPMMMTLWSTFFGVAFAIVSWVGLPMVAVYGEGSLFAVHAILMVVVASFLTFTLPGIIERQSGSISPKDVLRIHAQVYSSARILAPAAGWLFYTLTFASLLTLLPETLPADQRLWVTGAMPLASIASSMTVGVILLRYFDAVTIVIAGFALSAISAAMLAFSEGNAVLCLLLLAAMGLIQSASFAAVPQLNEPVADRALANGALAQTGNLGNTFGTPLLLWISVSAGFAIMMATAALLFIAGIASHLFLAARRSSEKLPAGL